VIRAVRPDASESNKPFHYSNNDQSPTWNWKNH